MADKRGRSLARRSHVWGAERAQSQAAAPHHVTARHYNSHNAPEACLVPPFLPLPAPLAEGAGAAEGRSRRAEGRWAAPSVTCWLPVSAGSPPPPSAGATMRKALGR